MDPTRLPSLEEIDAKIAALRKEADGWEELKRVAIGLGLGKQTTGGEQREAKATPAPTKASLKAPEHTGPYADMGIRLAAIEYLRKLGRPEGATKIARALSAGGKETESKAFHRTVDNMLRSDLKKKNPVVEKIGSKWGLIEWRLPKTR